MVKRIKILPVLTAAILIFLTSILSANLASSTGHDEGIKESDTITIPVGVIVPLEGEAQNVQLCISVFSSGEQICRQTVLKKEQGNNANIVDFAQTTMSTKSNSNSTISSGFSQTTVFQNNDDIAAGSSLAVTNTSKFDGNNSTGSNGSSEGTSSNSLTFILPSSLNLQNVQICMSVLSSGNQNCAQTVIENKGHQNPIQLDLTDNSKTNSTGVLEDKQVKTDNQSGDFKSPAEMDPNSESEESSCFTPCPPGQYCIQMCQPKGDTNQISPENQQHSDSLNNDESGNQMIGGNNTLN